MKIVVKGVMTVEDAIASVKHGVDGIWVSNHGARQLDTTPATIEVSSTHLTVVSSFYISHLLNGFLMAFLHTSFSYVLLLFPSSPCHVSILLYSTFTISYCTTKTISLTD